MKIHRARLQRIIKEELVRALREAMAPQLYKAGAGLGSARKIKTSDVDFEWGTYDGRHSNEVYWISNETGDELGSVQFPGDPYTYEPRGGRLVIISGPESSKGQIGVLIDRPQEGQQAAMVDEPTRFEDEEIIGDPCGALTNRELVDRLSKITLGEILADYFPYDKSQQIFNPGSFLGSDQFRKDPLWPGESDVVWSEQTLGMLLELKPYLIDLWDRSREARIAAAGPDDRTDHLSTGAKIWEWLIYDRGGLGLGLVVDWIRSGEVPCPPE